MGTPEAVGVPRLSEPLERVLPDRLQHPVALVVEAKQALVHERLQPIEVGTCDLRGGLERTAAGEDGQGPEQPLFLGREQLVAPADRRAQSALALRCVTGSAGEQRQALLQPLEDLRR